jgi:putative peptide zinc metalloprotease protein
VGWAFWVLILALAGIRLPIDGKDLIRNASPAIAPDNWIWLGICWLGLKIVHECSHGLCCLRYRGTVRSFGINMVMFAPLPFVDASSAWRFASRWQRMHVAFAGVFAELLLAALATIVRSSSDNKALRTLCLNVMLTGGVLTLLFNLNPLSRFVGYDMLCDWLEMPNLGQSAQQIVVQSLKRFFFGLRSPSSGFTWTTGATLWVYEALASGWRFLVTISMIIAAERLFHGSGLPLAILAATLWIARPLLNSMKYIARGHLVERPSRLRFAGILLFLAGTGSWLGKIVMWTEQLELPAVVDFVPAETVRCRAAGFVKSLIVEPGQHVRSGAELIRMMNPQVDFEIAELKLEVARAKVRQQYFQSVGDIASRQTEDAMLTSLESQLAEKQVMLDQLIVRAPVDGIVIASDLKNLPGQFLTPGDSVCIIGNPEERQVRR